MTNAKMTNQKSTVVKAKNTYEAFKDLGSSMFDQVSNNQMESSFDGDSWNEHEGYKEKRKQQKKANVFNYQTHYEQNTIHKEIRALTEQIHQELKVIKKADASLIEQAKDIEKITIGSLPEKPGIYHVRFLEVLLSILRSLRAKITESKTWLQALQSKRKKRGSLFAVLSKKKGTQYSLSQELQNSRSVQ